MIYERGRGSIYDLDANKDTTQETSVPDVMSSYFTRDPDPEPVRGGRGNIVERPNERSDYLASIIANQMAETQKDDRNQFSHGLDPIPYNLGVPVQPQQPVVNPQTVDNRFDLVDYYRQAQQFPVAPRNVSPFVTSPYDTGQGAVTDDPYILGDGEDYMPSYARYQKPMGKGYTQIIGEGIGDFGQAVYEDPLGVGKSIASGVYEEGKDLLTDPVGTIYDYGKNVVQSGINLGTSEGLAGYLPEGVTVDNATPEQLTAARQAKLGDIFQVASVIPAAQGVKLATNVAKPALSYGIGQVTSPFIRNAERLNKIAIEAQDQLEAAGFRNVGTEKNPKFTGVEVPSFIPDPKRNSGETVAEYRARQKIANAMYAKGASDAEVRRDAGIQRVSYKTLDGRTITRDFMLLQAPQFDVDKTIDMMREAGDDILEEVVSTGDGVKTRYSMSGGKGNRRLGQILENIEDYNLLNTPYDQSFRQTLVIPMTPDLEGDFEKAAGSAFRGDDVYPAFIDYNPLRARDGSSGLKGTYAGVPYMIGDVFPHEFDHLARGRGEKSIFDESAGGGSEQAGVYREQRKKDIDHILGNTEFFRDIKLKTNKLFTNMGEKGALEEFPDIGNSVNDYVDSGNSNSISQALKSDNYPSYKTVLKQNLDDAFGDSKIAVSRIEGYADPFAEKRRTLFEIDKDDVLFVGNPDEGELIIKADDGKIKSVRVDAADFDLKKLDTYEKGLKEERAVLAGPLSDFDLYELSPVEVLARGAVPGQPLTTTRTDLNLFGIMNPLVKGQKYTDIAGGLAKAYDDFRVATKYGGLKTGLSTLPYILGKKAYGTREVPVSYEQMVPYAVKPDDEVYREAMNVVFEDY